MGTLPKVSSHFDALFSFKYILNSQKPQFHSLNWHEFNEQSENKLISSDENTTVYTQYEQAQVTAVRARFDTMVCGVGSADRAWQWQTLRLWRFIFMDFSLFSCFKFRKNIQTPVFTSLATWNQFEIVIHICVWSDAFQSSLCTDRSLRRFIHVLLYSKLSFSERGFDAFFTLDSSIIDKSREQWFSAWKRSWEFAFFPTKKKTVLRAHSSVAETSLT